MSSSAVLYTFFYFIHFFTTCVVSIIGKYVLHNQSPYYWTVNLSPPLFLPPLLLLLVLLPFCLKHGLSAYFAQCIFLYLAIIS